MSNFINDFFKKDDSYQDILDSIVKPNAAARYLDEETGINYAAKHGFGKDYEFDAERTRIGQLDIKGALETTGAKIVASGLEDSGIMSKALGSVLGGADAEITKAGTKAYAENESAKNSAQNVKLQIAQHEDTLETANQRLRAEIEMQAAANESSLFGDILGGVGLFTGMGGGNLLKTIFK